MVTEVDLYISSLIKDELSDLIQQEGLNFFCEEDHEDLKFPALVLDPIDGTKGFSRAIRVFFFTSFNEGTKY